MSVRAACLVSWGVLALASTVSLGFSWFILLSAALTVGVLGVVAASVESRGWALFRLLAALYAGIAVVNIHIESFVFGILQGPAVVDAALVGLATGLFVTAALAVAFSGVRRESPGWIPHRLAEGLWWRLPLVVFTYIALYLVAGVLIYPLVRDFYQATGTFVNLRIETILFTELVRGLVYAGALVPLFLAMDGRRGRAAWLAGVSLSMLGGIAPLLMPVDDVLPWVVRRVHMVEILWSNFAFGALAAWLLVRRSSASVARPAVAAA